MRKNFGKLLNIKFINQFYCVNNNVVKQKFQKTNITFIALKKQFILYEKITFSLNKSS